MAGHSPRAVFDLVPVLDVARAIRDFDGGIVLVKRHCRHFPFRRFYDGQMFFMLKFGQGAPLRNRLVFVVTKRDFAARIALCAKFRRKKQRAFPKTYRLIGIHDHRKRHIEQKFDDVARFDLFLESDDTLVARHDFFAVYQHFEARVLRHAEGKLDFGIARHRLHNNFRLVFERIIGGLVQNNSYALEKRRNSARGIYHKAKSFVGFVAKIFREFRETLMHICRATAVIGFQPVNGTVGAHVEKVAFYTVCRNGVWLLDVLMRRIIFGNRCGKRVEAIKFQQVGVISVARFFDKRFKASHKLDHRAKFDAL